MRNTQSVLYKIGRIINWVVLGLWALMALIGLINIIIGAVNDRSWQVSSGVNNLVTGIIFVALVIVLIILVGKFEENALKAPVNELTPVILLMVFGFITGNWLYTVGGVFGIIAASQESNAKDNNSDNKSE